MDAELPGPRRIEIFRRALARARRLGVRGRTATVLAERTALRLTWQGTPPSNAAIDASLRRDARVSPQRLLWTGAAVGLLLPVIGLAGLILSAPSGTPASGVPRLPPIRPVALIEPLPAMVPAAEILPAVPPDVVPVRTSERRKAPPLSAHDGGRGAGGLYLTLPLYPSIICVLNSMERPEVVAEPSRLRPA